MKTHKNQLIKEQGAKTMKNEQSAMSSEQLAMNNRTNQRDKQNARPRTKNISHFSLLIRSPLLLARFGALAPFLAS